MVSSESPRRTPRTSYGSSIGQDYLGIGLANSRYSVLLNIGKCLTFRFLLHRGRFHDSPGTDVSAFLSTGCHRGTRGEVHQVDCGVAIPIVDDAAFNA